ncbi:Starch-binding associating with outer membrane [Parapedobacter luteus]|uniref:Starch-binding associating with outer membrane n=1 Tax=Parapedobacter luteus TaxID=623280 RepID=A0A1T5A645_9SPHI|nr:RagB/SusD family nutrient uptake outer membrane protein [Parapedobacter luteus]SKB30365.1 Starch-binding associating with outer membrane [Parapedobacter luteus]
MTINIKNISRLVCRLTCAVALIGASACSNDFIDIRPESSTTTDLLYQTDGDFRDAITAVYTALQTQYDDFWIFADVPGEDVTQEVVKNDPWYFADVFAMQDNTPVLATTWSNYYVAITRANLVLHHIQNIDAQSLPQRDRHIGESRFLRALAYFDLVRIFGAVPKVTTPLTTEEAYNLPREAAENVYRDVIIPDLLDAAERLPTAYGGADVGRATSGAAKALLGRVYLTIHDFAKAEQILGEVTTLGYALLPNYDDLFDYTKDEHHSEYIFDIEYEEGMGNQGSVFTHRFMPNSSAMADHYGIRGGELAETFSPTPALRALFEPEDKRRNVTVGTTGGFTNSQGDFVRLPAATSQNYTLKYVTSVNLVGDSRANWKVIRYADVLLMYAEALNENGKTPEAIEQLNLVRHRAGVQPVATDNRDEARELIYRERRLELSFEGHRWFDLVRTGRAFETLQPLGMQSFMTLFPVPLSQVQIINNPAIFPQNPGYN